MAQRGKSGLGGKGQSRKLPPQPRAKNLPDQEQELRAALSGRLLLLRYQPIIRLRNGHTAALEGLVRWPRQEALLQAGAFVQANDAEQQRAKLAMQGFNAKVYERDNQGRIVYRVRIGPFDAKADADKLQAEVQAAGLEAAVVRAQR